MYLKKKILLTILFQKEKLKSGMMFGSVPTVLFYPEWASDMALWWHQTAWFHKIFLPVQLQKGLNTGLVRILFKNF